MTPRMRTRKHNTGAWGGDTKPLKTTKNDMVPPGVQKPTCQNHEELYVVSACLRRGRSRGHHVQAWRREVSSSWQVSLWRVRQDPWEYMEGETSGVCCLSVLCSTPGEQAGVICPLDRDAFHRLGTRCVWVWLSSHGSLALSPSSEAPSGRRPGVKNTFGIVPSGTCKSSVRSCRAPDLQTQATQWMFSTFGLSALWLLTGKS